MHAVVDQHGGLGRGLVDPVHVDRFERMLLVDGQVARPPVLLA
jgi:hypothetical protein